MNLPSMTPEQRQEMLEKSKQAKLDRKEWALKNLKTKYADEPLWRDLAKEYNVKLPTRYHKAAGKYVQRVLKQIGRDSEWWEGWTGYKNGNREAEDNPRLSALAQSGLILEQHDYDVRMGR